MNVGDTIELLAMPDDPDPIPVGTRGEVVGQHHYGHAGKPHRLLMVRWENGRSLNVTMPPDEVRVVASVVKHKCAECSGTIHVPEDLNAMGMITKPCAAEGRTHCVVA